MVLCCKDAVKNETDQYQHVGILNEPINFKNTNLFTTFEPFKIIDLLTLRDIETGNSVVVKGIHGRSSFRRRISEMGFVRGKPVLVLKNAPFRDPIEYQIMGYNISLRRSEAALIEVMPPEEAAQHEDIFNGTLTFDKRMLKGIRPVKSIKIAFVGNPNSGKTSIFNALTGRQEHVGNYSGVTVDAKRAKIHFQDYTIHLTDLPGTYSLSPNSPDELFVRDHLLKEHPDVVINVVDSTNLERNLYLTTQLIDMDIPIVISLNMQDELEKSGDRLNTEQFSKITGIPTVWTIGSKKKGCNSILRKAIEVFENTEPDQRHIHINYGPELELSINRVQKEIWKASNYVREFSSRYFALRLIDEDEHTKKNISYLNNTEIYIIDVARNQETKRLERLHNENAQTLITNARYGFIRGALKETYKASAQPQKKHISERIDRLLTGKHTGFPFFLLALWIMFQATFIIGQYPAEWIELSVSWLGNLIGSTLNEGPARDLIVDGIFGGVGGVLVFLAQHCDPLFLYIAHGRYRIHVASCLYHG
jgi:ferrous iron transport protein B